jgi:hypothetical protein
VTPLTRILFNVVVDMLSILINRAKEENQIKGLVPNLIDEGLSILQYADSTILIIDHDFEKHKIWNYYFVHLNNYQFSK